MSKNPNAHLPHQRRAVEQDGTVHAARFAPGGFTTRCAVYPAPEAVELNAAPTHAVTCRDCLDAAPAKEDTMTFNPEKIPTADYPYPVGTVLLGTGGLSTVIDRDGYAFLACCQKHEDAETASGYYPQRDNGRLLGLGHERTDFEPGGYDCPNLPGTCP